jgi:hypothetical protein
VVYTEGNNVVHLHNIPAGTYEVKRFDPREGTYERLPDFAGFGLVELSTPDRQDWAFVLRRKSSTARSLQ